MVFKEFIGMKLSNTLKNTASRIIALSALLTLVSGSMAVGLAQGSASESGNFVRDNKYPSTSAMLDAFIQRELRQKQIPGLSIALVDGDKIVWRKGFGYSDPATKTPITDDTIFRVGSVSKVIY